MIGIVVVSHSSKVAEGICDMVKQISSRDGAEMPIYPAGGNAQGGLGTDLKICCWKSKSIFYI